MLNKIIGTNSFSQITNKRSRGTYNTVLHDIFQYVDDTSNIIASSNISELQNYINDYFVLLESYYNANELVLNPDKSKLLVTCKNKFREMTKDINLIASDYVIEQSNRIKVLGIYITSGLSNQSNINNIVSKINYRQQILREIFKYCDNRT